MFNDIYRTPSKLTSFSELKELHNKNAMGTGYQYPEIKWSGRGVDQPQPSSAEVKERVELYLYFSVSSRPVLYIFYTLKFIVKISTESA